MSSKPGVHISSKFIDYGIARKLHGAGKAAQGLLDAQVAKDSNFYIPKDTGNLEGSVLRSDMGSGQIEWDAEYAKKLYYGVDYHFSKDQNPNARAMWFEEAKSTKLDSWIALVKNAFRAGL